MRCSTPRRNSRCRCRSPPTAGACASRSATVPPGTRRLRIRCSTPRTGGACTSCTRCPRRGASRSDGTDPARRCGSRRRWRRRTMPPRRRAAGSEPPAGAAPGRPSGAPAAPDGRRRHRPRRRPQRRPWWEASRPGPCRACGRCSTGCATRSWPPTSRAGSVTPTRRPTISWAGPADPWSAGRSSISCPSHSPRRWASTSGRSSAPGRATSSGAAWTPSSSGPTEPTSTRSWSSASSSTRSPAGWSSASSAPATRRSCSAGRS